MTSVSPIAHPVDRLFLHRDCIFTRNAHSLLDESRCVMSRAEVTRDSMRSSVTSRRDLLNSRKVSIATHLRRFASRSRFSPLILRWFSRVAARNFIRCAISWPALLAGPSGASERVPLTLDNIRRKTVTPSSLLDLLRNTLQSALREPCEPRLGGESERRRLSRGVNRHRESLLATLAPRPRKRGRSPARRIPNRSREITRRYPSDDCYALRMRLLLIVFWTWIANRSCRFSRGESTDVRRYRQIDYYVVNVIPCFTDPRRHLCIARKRAGHCTRCDFQTSRPIIRANPSFGITERTFLLEIRQIKI